MVSFSTGTHYLTLQGLNMLTRSHVWGDNETMGDPQRRIFSRTQEGKGERRQNRGLINNGTHGGVATGRNAGASAIPAQHAKDKRAENKG